MVFFSKIVFSYYFFNYIYNVKFFPMTPHIMKAETRARKEKDKESHKLYCSVAGLQALEETLLEFPEFRVLFEQQVVDDELKKAKAAEAKARRIVYKNK